MHSSGYDKANLILKNRASGYSLGDDGELVNSTYIHMSFPAGAGALYSTVKDLYLWDQALYTKKLLTKKSLDAMFTSFEGNYGYGWAITERFDKRLVAHGGGIDGFSTDIRRYIDDNVLIVILSNFEHCPTAKMADKLTAIVFGEKYEPPKKHIIVKVDPKIYDQYVGKYKLNENFFITVTKEDNKIITQATKQRKIQIYPLSETKFLARQVDAIITFVKDNTGKVIKFILHQGGKEETYTKVN